MPTKPYKTPLPTPRSPEERAALASVRQQQDVEAEERAAEEKAVLEAENKAVASAETTKKAKPRKRAAKK